MVKQNILEEEAVWAEVSKQSSLVRTRGVTESSRRQEWKESLGLSHFVLVRNGKQLKVLSRYIVT